MNNLPQSIILDIIDSLCNIVANAELVIDINMAGTTDIYTVPCDDIERAKTLLSQLVQAKEPIK